VIVDGEVLMRERSLTGLEEPTIIEEACRARMNLMRALKERG